MICLAFEKHAWGCKHLLHDDQNCKITRIELKPTKSLSYQFHEKRSETFTIIDGEALVFLNDDRFLLDPGNSINIPAGVIHRIENTLSKKLIFIEIQIGKNLNIKDEKIIDEEQIDFEALSKMTAK